MVAANFRRLVASRVFFASWFLLRLKTFLELGEVVGDLDRLRQDLARG